VSTFRTQIDIRRQHFLSKFRQLSEHSYPYSTMPLDSEGNFLCKLHLHTA
jgi:hypothetical protein